MNIPQDKVKVLKCEVCKADTPVNSNYPITKVTCTKCWQHQKK